MSGHHYQYHWGRDALSRVIFASILIYAGLIFLASTTGFLPRVEGTSEWNWIMLGAGGLFLLEGVIRAISIDQQEPHMMKLIGGVLLLGFGAGPIFGLDLSAKWWPIVLIIVGLGALARGLRK
jgi:hypothetical protein